MHFRLATADDAKAILHVTQAAFQQYAQNAGNTAASAALNETIDDVIRDINEKHVFVLTKDDEVIGSVRVTITGEKGYFSRFGVLPEHNSNGGGKRLIQEVDAFLIQKGVKHLYLHTASKVSFLVRFYYANGFYIESTSTDRGYIRALMCKDYE